MSELIDTGVLLEVPEYQRVDVDDQESTHALQNGTDAEGLRAARENPGEVVPEEELQ